MHIVTGSGVSEKQLENQSLPPYNMPQSLFVVTKHYLSAFVMNCDNCLYLFLFFSVSFLYINVGLGDFFSGQTEKGR